MKMCAVPTCPACAEEEETSHHFLGRCSARMLNRYSISGSHLVEAGDLKRLNQQVLHSLQEPLKCYIGFSHWAKQIHS